MSFNYTLGSSDGSDAAKKLRDHLHFDVMRIAPKKDPSYTSGNDPDTIDFNAGVTLKVGINEGGAGWPSEFTNGNIYKQGHLHSVDFLELVVREIIVPKMIPEAIAKASEDGTLEADSSALLAALQEDGSLYLNADGLEVLRHQLTLTDIANKFFSLPIDLQYGKRYKISLNVQYAEGDSEEIEHLHMGYVKTNDDDKLNAVVVAHNNYKNEPDTNNKDVLVGALSDYNDNWGDNWIRRFQPKPVMTIQRHGATSEILSNRALVTVSDYQWQGANDIEKREIQGFLVKIDGEGWVPGDDSHLVLSEGFDAEYAKTDNFFARHTTYPDTLGENEKARYYKAIPADATTNTGTDLANLGSAFSVGTLGVVAGKQVALKGSRPAGPIKKTFRINVEKDGENLKYHIVDAEAFDNKDVVNRINNSPGVFYTDGGHDNAPGAVAASIPSWGNLQVGGSLVKSNDSRAFNQKGNVRRYISPLDTSELIEKKLVEGSNSDTFTFLIAAAGSPDFFSTPINGAVVASLNNGVNQKISVAVSQGIIRNDFSDVVEIKPTGLESEARVDIVETLVSKDKGLEDNNIEVNALVPVSKIGDFDPKDSPNNGLPQVAIFSYPLSRADLDTDTTGGNTAGDGNLDIPNDGTGDPGDLRLNSALFNIGTPSLTQTLYSHMKAKADDPLHKLRHHGILNANQVNRVFNSIVVNSEDSDNNGTIETGGAKEGLGLKIDLGDNDASNEQTFPSAESMGSPLENFDYGKADKPAIPEVIAIFLITMTQVADPASTDSGAGSSDNLDVKPVILFPSRAATAATIADATEYDPWPNTFADGFDIEVTNGLLNGANKFVGHKIQYKYENTDGTFSAWQDADYATAPSWKEAQGGVTTLKFKKENLTTSHQENKWNTGAVFKVRVEYKSDTKNEEKYSLESGKLVLTRGKTALATHITNNVSLEFAPTQNGAVGGVFNIGHDDDEYVSGSGYPDFVVSEIDANYVKTGSATLDTYGTVTTGTMSTSLSITKGMAFTPKVTWTIQHKNIPQLTHTVTLSAGTFYHYVNPDDIPKDLSLILKNTDTVSRTEGQSDVNVINSSSASIGTADFIITNAKEDDGRVRIITDANALKADTGLTLSGLVETLSSGSVTVSVNVTSLDNIYQEVKIDLITVNRNGNNQFSADDVTGWSGALEISTTGVTAYPTIFSIGANVSADTSVYHHDNFDTFGGNRSHGTSVSDALTNEIEITPTIVDQLKSDTHPDYNLFTGNTKTFTYDTINESNQQTIEGDIDTALAATFTKYKNESKTWLQAGKVPMINVSIGSTATPHTSLLGVNLGLTEQVAQSGSATFAEISVKNLVDNTGVWSSNGDETFDPVNQTITFSISHDGYSAAADPVNAAPTNFYDVVKPSDPANLLPSFNQTASSSLSADLTFSFADFHGGDDDANTHVEPQPTATYSITNVAEAKNGVNTITGFTIQYGTSPTSFTVDLSLPDISEFINPDIEAEVRDLIDFYGKLSDANGDPHAATALQIELFDETVLSNYTNSGAPQLQHIAACLSGKTLADIGFSHTSFNTARNGVVNGATFNLNITTSGSNSLSTTPALMPLMAAKVNNHEYLNIENIIKRAHPTDDSIESLSDYNTAINNGDRIELYNVKERAAHSDSGMPLQKQRMVLYIENKHRTTLTAATVILVYFNSVDNTTRVVVNSLSYKGQLGEAKSDHITRIKSVLVDPDAADAQTGVLLETPGKVVNSLSTYLVGDANSNHHNTLAAGPSNALSSANGNLPTSISYFFSDYEFEGQGSNEHLVLGLLTANVRNSEIDENDRFTDTYLFDTSVDNATLDGMEQIKLKANVNEAGAINQDNGGYILNLG